MRHVFIVVLLVFGLGLLCGLRAERATHRAALATLKAEQDEAARQAAVAAAARLQAAQQRGDALTEQLLGRSREIDRLTKEKRHALTQTTRGTTCLAAGTLRVLDGAPGLRFTAPAEAAGRAAAADGPVATDTDVAAWIVDAGAQYEQCRERLDKLIDWHKEIAP